MTQPLATALLLPLLLTIGVAADPPPTPIPEEPPAPEMPAAPTQSLDAFMTLFITQEREVRRAALERIEAGWGPGSLAVALDVLHIGGRTGMPWLDDLLAVMQRGTGKAHPLDINAWSRELWDNPQPMLEGYATLKGRLYQLLDPRFEAYFHDDRTSLIRLDEVRWGGVGQDGIPPLREPTMIDPQEATYLRDSDIVFGVEINGDRRAYPKRILAWHEMFTDQIGGVDVAGVYCTLCGTVVIYETQHAGTLHTLGTSGFLYRSNKLMYDKATQSLWSTLQGAPVIGPLADHDPPITIERRPVVTTTWGEWKARHPDTTVLSIDTGHRRNYAEGAAYRAYFATDALMFAAPRPSEGIANKQEVLGIAIGSAPTLAIDARRLMQDRVYHDQIGDSPIVVLTDDSGANRVYRSDGVRFVSYKYRIAVDDKGGEWSEEESRLTGPEGAVLERIPAQRAFWFGWNNAFDAVRYIGPNPLD